jgi:thiamine-monophosphate kinase
MRSFRNKKQEARSKRQEARGKNLSEADIIKKLKRVERAHPAVIRGIGDDCAVLKSLNKNEVLLCTTDLLIEKIDFDFAFTDPYRLGMKSLAVNLSDIAAMGGAPLYYTVSLGFPRELVGDFVGPFYRGLRRVERKFNVALIGGDLSRAPSDVFISITVLGKAQRDKVVYRSGAKPGDLIFVTGTLGGSATGLRLLKEGHRIEDAEGIIHQALRTHLCPVPRVAAGRWLAEHKIASSMIDLSDGLSTDLHHLCEESHVGAQIYADQIPIASATRALEDAPLAAALDGGEDFELLFTVPENNVKRFRQSYPFRKPPTTHIGHVINWREGVQITYGDGRQKKLLPQGYDHFKT